MYCTLILRPTVNQMCSREFHNPPIALETAEHPWVPLSRQSDEIYETSPPPSGHVKQSQASDFVRLQNSAHVACVTEKYQLFGNVLQAGLQTKERQPVDVVFVFLSSSPLT